jgi:hypothetical protein
MPKSSPTEGPRENESLQSQIERYRSLSVMWMEKAEAYKLEAADLRRQLEQASTTLSGLRSRMSQQGPR